MGVPLENFTPFRSEMVYVSPSFDRVEPVARSGVTLLPLLVTVNSGWVICSMIQIELLSKTVDSSSDCASCGLAKTRFPPVTGVPALAELLLVPLAADDEEPPPPQPASTTRAAPADRAVVRI